MPNKWIKIYKSDSNTYPNGEQEIFIVNKKGIVELATFQWFENEPLFYSHQYYYGERVRRNPTHWMPISLPEPPKPK